VGPAWLVSICGGRRQAGQSPWGMESNEDAIYGEEGSSQVEDKAVIGVAELALPVIRQLFQDRPRNLR
jgi:hypothetical protein